MAANKIDSRQLLREVAEEFQRERGSLDPEEILSFLEGKLPPRRMEAVREQLAWDPEAARLAADLAVPPEPAEPGEEGYFSPEQIEAGLAAIKEKVRPEAPLVALASRELRRQRHRLQRRWALATAASLAMALVGGWIVARTTLAPNARGVPFYEVNPVETQRGGAPGDEGVLAVPRSEAGYYLVLRLLPNQMRQGRVFQAEVRQVIDSGMTQTLAKVQGLPVSADGSLGLLIRPGLLDSGLYEVVVAAAGSPGEKGAAFLVRVEN